MRLIAPCVVGSLILIFAMPVFAQSYDAEIVDCAGEATDRMGERKLRLK